MYKSLLRPILFTLGPEQAHYTTLNSLRFFSQIPGVGNLFRKIYHFDQPSLKRKLFGLEFTNPVGLAAGLDKNGAYVDALAALGFGFIEVGTVTPLPQPGNPKPRLFRIPKDQALINRMGFNNDGAVKISERLGRRKSRIIIGGNIGRNKSTPNEKAANDYITCLEHLHPVVDYFVVNVSSPNTPGLRELQSKENLVRLLSLIQEANLKKTSPKPILLKISPDLNREELDEIVSAASECQIAGLVATNTTISRTGLQTSAEKIEKMGPGGLSGVPLTGTSRNILLELRERTGPDLPIIASGGIMTPHDAIERLKAGADLVQVYTGLIYEGPGITKRICKEIG